MKKSALKFALAPSLGFVLLGASAQAGDVTSLTCRTSDGHSYLQLTVQDHSVTNLTVDGYAILSEGKQRPDSAIGHEVFNVNVSKLSERPEGTAELRVNLQDYSDVRSYEIILARAAREVSVVCTFQSSDGDNLPHVSTVPLKCE